MNFILGYKPDVLVLDPHDLEDILVSIIEIAERIGRLDEGHRLVRSLENRIDNIKSIVEAKTAAVGNIAQATNKAKPRIVCIEWIEPFFICRPFGSTNDRYCRSYKWTEQSKTTITLKG